MEFNLNRKKFEKKFLNDIKLGILNFYSGRYHNVDIKYKMSKYNYTFSIYADVDVIEDGEWCRERVLLKTYNNIQAMNNFAQIPISEYMEEYNDADKGYLQKFLDEMEAIVIMYLTLGMDLKMDHDNKWKRYQVVYNTGLKTFMSSKHISMNYSYNDVMTKEEYKTNINYLKKSLSRYYEESIK